MGQRGQNARCHQPAVAGRQGAGGVADHEDHHQPYQHLLARPASRNRGEDRRADGNAEGIAGDQHSGGRNGNAEFAADFQQEAHDDEFGNADAEGAGRQGIERHRHWSSILLNSIDREDRPSSSSEIEYR